MASWQAKHRDPLFDQSTQAALERRSKEAVGAVLIIVGIVVAMMLGSWSSDDPSFLSATDAPAQNMLGSLGAYIASPLMMIAGHGSWVLVVAAWIWGLRLMLHKGEDRVMRAIFTPIAVALVSVYASTLVPGPEWQQNYGLGGHFGDMVMGAMLNLLPMKAQLGIRVAAFLVALAVIAAGAFVLGFNRSELMIQWRRFVRGLSTALHLTQRAAAGAATLGRRLRDRVKRTPEDSPSKAATPRRRVAAAPAFELEEELPEPELIERDSDYDGDGPTEEEVRGRISDAIRSSTAKTSVLKTVASRLARDNAARTLPPMPEDDEDGPGLFGAGPSNPVIAPPRRPDPAPRAPERTMPFDESGTAYERPPLSLLSAPAASDHPPVSQEVLMENARMLEAVLDDYGVKGQITEVRPGPVVTLYELEPAPGLKASRVIGLADDIARSMSALSARVSTVPGRSVIGIELPNMRREKVLLREIFASRAFGDGTQPLPLALGKDIGGDPVVANLAKMPHLLIAGTT
ncbi:DNA translocase FtsK 4TM domain-containing protein, partial [Paracoccus sp. (in: a-proteobacteria)]|uniref:DNA translocase FtsK n=1 Tax=Paracoccus sp. TaxID=267 RepID=UPI00396CE971